MIIEIVSFGIDSSFSITFLDYINIFRSPRAIAVVR